MSQPGNVLRIFERGGRFARKSASPNVRKNPAGRDNA